MPCKALSLFMAFLLVAISVPVAFAAQVSLAATNITEFPSVNGTIYYGQTVGESLTLSGGEVQYNGEVIPGVFVHTNLNERPTGGGTVAMRASFTFNPTDTENYSGFSVRYSRDVTYLVQPTTPVYVDENIKPTVETEVEAGTKLSDITINGSTVKNPYYPEESRFLSQTWTWANPDTIVEKSGYFDALIKGDKKNYNDLICSIYVEVAGSIIVPTIDVSEIVLSYDKDQTGSDISFDGAKAYVTNDDGSITEVPGTFSVPEVNKDKVIEVGKYDMPAIFTPTDTETYSTVEFTVPVNVSKGIIKFVDENGNEIVPEITVPYGTKFYDVVRLLQPYVKGAEYTALSLGDLEYKQCEDGTFTVTASAPSDGKHYETTELSFKIVIEKKAINPKLYSEPGKLYIEDTSGIYNPTGTFTLEYTIDGVEQTPITGIKYLERFDWNPTQSGDYEYEIIYNEATEKEYYIINDFTASNAVTLSWGFSATGSLDGEYQYGSEVTLEAPATDPEKADTPYYGFVKWEDAKGNTGLSEEELENREITFTMPDGEVDLNATYKFDFLLCIRYYIQIVVDFFTSFFQSIGTLF